MHEINQHLPANNQTPSLGLDLAVRYYCADEILVEPALGQVKVANQVARLTPINMKVLCVLLEHAGNVVSRNTIYQAVWANQIVSDDTLTRAISDIRGLFRSLKVDTKLIDTIPKKGYRWLVSCRAEKSLPGTTSESEAQENTAQTIGGASQAHSTQPTNISDNAIHNPPVVENSVTKRQLSEIQSSPTWIRWGAWFLAAIGFFGVLVITTIWLVNQQFNERFIKIALMPIQTDAAVNKQVADLLSESLQQQVLETSDIRFLSSRVGYRQQHSLIPYLADEFSVRWLIEAEIRDNAGGARVSLKLVDARSAVVLASESENIQINQKDIDIFTKRFISQISQSQLYQ